MYVVTVVPIMRGTPIPELTYYTIREVRPGDIVTITIRNSSQKGIAIRVENITDMRARLRSQEYELQKLGPEAPTPLLSEAQILMCTKTALHHAATVGAVLHTLLPATIVETCPSIPHTSLTPGAFQPLALQNIYSERIAIYKNIAREAMAKQESLLILTPRRAVAEDVYRNLSKGIERHVTLLHGSLSRKKILTIWEDYARDPKPRIIIGTSLSLTLPLHQLKTIIVERESDDAYTMIERPHVDIRIAATEYARALGARIILSDTVLRTKTTIECEQSYREHYMPPLHKVRTTAQQTVVHKKKEERGF
ncbi:MAG: Primosomal protein, partial [Candidatus Parcubacteria bacterium]